jgi:hypothetical protein
MSERWEMMVDPWRQSKWRNPKFKGMPKNLKRLPMRQWNWIRLYVAFFWIAMAVIGLLEWFWL